MGVDSTQRMVANSLFSFVARKIEEEEQRPAPKLARRPRTIIKWSDSSPMAGFDMARSVSLAAIPLVNNVSEHVLDLYMEVKEFRKVYCCHYLYVAVMRIRSSGQIRKCTCLQRHRHLDLGATFSEKSW